MLLLEIGNEMSPVARDDIEGVLLEKTADHPIEAWIQVRSATDEPCCYSHAGPGCGAARD